ncbi:hypothetical protein F4782DRAFT_547098 [Xylaria castorea]|nr:hypothetical protein F4782DRAFT_547098 [Xylaria castorea]
MDQNEEQPDTVRRSPGRPRKNVQHDRRGRPITTNRGRYQSRGLRKTKTKFVAPPTQIRTRLRAGASPKDYKQGIPKPRVPARQNDEDEDEDEGDDDNDESGSNASSSEEPPRRHIHRQSRKDAHSKGADGDSNEDSDPFALTDDGDSGGQSSRPLPGSSRGGRSLGRHQIEDDGMPIDEDMDIDQDDFGYVPDDDDEFPFSEELEAETPGRRSRQVIAKTPAKRHQGDSPDLGAARPPPKRQALQTDYRGRPSLLEDHGWQPSLGHHTKGKSSSQGELRQALQTQYRGQPSFLEDHGWQPSVGHHTKGESSSRGELRQDRRLTIGDTPLKILEIAKLQVRLLYPLVERSYLDKDTTRGSYWDCSIEDEFKKLYRRDEHDSRFIHGPRGDSDELELWKMVLLRYRTLLPHLFTYGLKLGEDCYEAPESIMLSSKASYMLQKICAHPIWGRSFDVLRFVLQIAITYSIDEHCDPLGPPADYTSVEDYLRPLVDKDHQEMFSGTVSYRIWKRNKQDDRKEIYDLYNEFLKQIKSSPAKSKAESSLFILTIDVMDSVLRALEALDPSIYPMSTAECVEAFRQYYGVILAGVEPKDNKQLMDVKWELELLQLRDEEIRAAIKKLDVKDAYLYDIPHPSRKHNDTFPLYRHDLSLDRNALPALDGTAMWIDPKRCTLSRLDRIDNRRVEALREFRDRLVDVVSRRVPPSSVSRAPSGQEVPGDVEDPGAHGMLEAPEAGAREAKALEKARKAKALEQAREKVREAEALEQYLEARVLEQEDEVMGDPSDLSVTQNLPFRNQAGLGEMSRVPPAAMTSGEALIRVSGNKMTPRFPVRRPHNGSNWTAVRILPRRTLYESMETAADPNQALEISRFNASRIASRKQQRLDTRPNLVSTKVVPRLRRNV